MQNQLPSLPNEHVLMTVQNQRQRYENTLASLILRPFSVLHAETLKAWNEPGNEVTYKLQVYSRFMITIQPQYTLIASHYLPDLMLKTQYTFSLIGIIVASCRYA